MTRARNSANLASDGNLFVDISNDRTGIGSVAPAQNLHVAGTAGFHGDTTFVGDLYNTTWDRSANTLQIKPNAILKIGDGSTDTEIKNDGTNTFITHSPITAFYVAANTFQVFGSGNRSGNVYDSTLLRCHNGVAELGHEIPSGGAQGFKLATTAYGVNVTGTTDTDGLIVSGVATVTTMNVTGVLTYDDVTSIDSIGIITARSNIDCNGNLDVAGTSNFVGDATFNGGAGAITLGAGDDISFTNGNWTGNHTKIQHHNNSLYIQGGSGANDNKAIIFRDDGGTDRWYVRHDGHFYPNTDSTYDIGSSSVRVRNGYFDTLYGDGSNLTGITQTTISGNANNRIITGSGTANTLNAESTFTYDGDGLLSMTSTSGSAEFTIVGPSNTDSGIYFNDGSNDGALVYDHSSRELKFRVAGQTRALINSDGNFGVGTNSPSSIIHATGSDTSTGYQFINTHTTSGFGAFIKGGGTTADRYALRVDNAAGDEIFRVSANKRVGINNPTPSYTLSVVGDSGGNFAASSNSTNGVLSIVGKNSSGSVSAISRIKSYPEGSSNQSHMTFETRNSSNTMVERLRLDATGRLAFGNVSNNSSYDTNAQNILLANESGNFGITIRSGGSDPYAMIHFADGVSNADETRAGRIFYHHTQNAMVFSTANTERYRVNSAGQVLIGTTTAPAYINRRLTVAQGSSGNTTVAIEVRSPTNGDGRIIFTDSTSSGNTGAYKGQIRYDQTNDFMSFNTNGDNERFRITGDGPHLLLGGTSDVNEITESASNTGMVIGSTGVGNGGIAIINSTSGTGRIYFGDAVGSNAARNRGQINYYHNGDYMLFATAGTERLRIDSNGRLTLSDSEGIKLSAKTSSLYAIDASLSYYASNNAVYLNGAGASGWLRLSAAGSANNRTAINLYGHSYSSSDRIDFRTNSSERIRIESDGGTIISNAGSFPSSTSETLHVQGEGHNGHGTTNTRSVFNITAAMTSRPGNGGGGLWVGARTNEDTAVVGTRTAAGNLAIETYNSGWGERLRINNVGNLLLGTTSTSGTSSNARDIVIGSIGDSTNRGITFATTATAAIRWADSGDNAQGRIQYSNSTDLMTFHTDNFICASLDSSGHVTLGRDYSNNPSNVLTGITTVRGHCVNTGTTDNDFAQLYLKNSSSSGNSSASIRGYREDSNYSTGLRFYTHSSNSSGGDGAERMRIDSTGRVLIGTTENVVSKLYVSGGSFSLTGSDSNFGGGGNRVFLDHDNNDVRFGFTGGGGSNTSKGIRFYHVNNHNGTTNNNRITPFGEFRICHGAGSDASVSTDFVNGIGDASLDTVQSNLARLVMQERVSHWISFKTGGGTHYGSIVRSGSGVSYGSNSDYRLKDNVADLTGGITLVKQLRPVTFNWNDLSGLSKTETHQGFIAHEVQALLPDAVSGEKDGVEIWGDCTDSEGNVTQKHVPESKKKDGETWAKVGESIEDQQLDTGKLIPILTKALQEAIAKIETLETKVTALEEK